MDGIIKRFYLLLCPLILLGGMGTTARTIIGDDAQVSIKVESNKNTDSNVHSRSGSNEETVVRSAAEIFDEYQSKIEKLAKKCEERGMTLEAKVTRSNIYQKKQFYFVIPLLSNKPGETKLPSDATKEQQSWFEALRRLKVNYADQSFTVAERFGGKKKGHEAVACVLQTLFINPDHEGARKFFGQTLYNGEWRSQWEIKKLENGYVDDPEFGWIVKEYVERYREGKRFYRNQWISVEEENKRISASSSGWKVETEHFSILSRVSLERGVEISRFLETYYQVWLRLFYPFIANENQWAARLYRSEPITSKRHQVILYKDRKEYLRELRKYDKNASQSVGGYFPEMRCIFVYEPDPNDANDCFELFPMLAHEATHQLFYECNIPNSSRAKPDYSNLASNANFWIIEGVAISSESFHFDLPRNKAEIGGYKNVFRMMDALELLFDNKEYIPLRKFAGMSRKEFQSYEDLNFLYSQAAGLTFFLMFYKDGTYRNAYIKYLFLIYQGIDAQDSLERLTGKSFEELDKEYLEFMRTIRDRI